MITYWEFGDWVDEDVDCNCGDIWNPKEEA